MRAILHRGIRQVEVRTIERPEVRAGTVLVRVGAVGICGTDLNGFRKDSGSYMRPHGHEYAGTIVEVGAGVSPARIGQRVTADSFLNAMCGKCAYCRSGHAFHCINKELPFATGGFADYVLVKERALFALPDCVDDALGALVEPLAVGIHAVRKIKVTPGMTGVVIGAGAIGMGVLAGALDAGAKRMFVVAKHEFQRAMAQRIGAVDCLPPEPWAAHEAILSATQDGVDFVIEAVGGAGPTLDLACSLVKPQGSICVVGAFDPGFRGLELSAALAKEVTLHFSNCYGVTDGRHDFELAIDLLSRRGSELRSLITHEFRMGDGPLAFSIADDKRSGAIKVQIRP